MPKKEVKMNWGAEGQGWADFMRSWVGFTLLMLAVGIVACFLVPSVGSAGLHKVKGSPVAIRGYKVQVIGLQVTGGEPEVLCGISHRSLGAVTWTLQFGDTLLIVDNRNYPIREWGVVERKVENLTAGLGNVRDAYHHEVVASFQFADALPPGWNLKSMQFSFELSGFVTSPQRGKYSLPSIRFRSQLSKRNIEALPSFNSLGDAAGVADFVGRVGFHLVNAPYDVRFHMLPPIWLSTLAAVLGAALFGIALDTILGVWRGAMKVPRPLGVVANPFQRLFGTGRTQSVHQLGRRMIWGKVYTWLAIGVPASVVLAAVISRQFNGYHQFGAISMLMTIPVLAGFVLLLFPGYLYRSFFKTLNCPSCAREIGLVKECGCVADCPPTRRHVLTPCPTCGTYWEGMECPSCKELVIFAEFYDWEEVLNRGKRYITSPNPSYYLALLALGVSGTSGILMLAISSQLSVGWFTVSAIAALVSGVWLLRAPRKRMLANPHYEAQEE